MKIVTLDKLKKFADALFARVENDARPNLDNARDEWAYDRGDTFTGAGPGIAGSRIHGLLADDALISGVQISGSLPGYKMSWDGVIVPGTRVQGDLNLAYIDGSHIKGQISGSLVYGYMPGARIDGSHVSGDLVYAKIGGSQIIGQIQGSQVYGTLYAAYIDGSQITGQIPASRVYGYLTGATIGGSQITGPIQGSQVSGALTFATIGGSQILGSIDGTLVSGDLTHATITDLTRCTVGSVSGTSFTSGAIMVNYPAGNIRKVGVSDLQIRIAQGFGSYLTSVPGSKISWEGATIPGSLIDWTGVTIPGTAIENETNGTTPDADPESTAE